MGQPQAPRPFRSGNPSSLPLDKLERIREYGANHLINYIKDINWDVTVRKLTAKRGVDVIVETVGASTWERSIRALGKGGRLVTSGATSGPIGPTDIRYLFRREHSLLGSNGWTHNELLRVAKLTFEGRLHPVGRQGAAARAHRGGRDRAGAPAGLRQGDHCSLTTRLRDLGSRCRSAGSSSASPPWTACAATRPQTRRRAGRHAPHHRLAAGGAVPVAGERGAPAGRRELILTRGCMRADSLDLYTGDALVTSAIDGAEGRPVLNVTPQ